ncbi:adenyl cyclase [Iris pallida]|uniref:Adenyl cyclase n=1 Tax=Iris pallida TaxID=29817 RepID=A0AAX6G100_IRIPA|nr:adenyl cyclase [Iris pallida]
MLRSLRSPASRRLAAVIRATDVGSVPSPPPPLHLRPALSSQHPLHHHHSILGFHPFSSPMVSACFSSEAASAAPAEESSTAATASEVVAELYEKMLTSVEKARTMPPNANLWSLVESCANEEDVKLLFQILQRLRVFRLSNLRIHSNFNCHLCRRVSEACVRANAIDYGLKALWNHNVYGLTPSVSSAHCFLLHAKEKNDAKLMVRIMKVMGKNSLPLQPGTANIVFSICYNTNDWALMSKYTKRFLKAKVKLHRTAFDIWLDFAAKVGDTKSIWKIEKLRSATVKKHTVASVFSCAKGYLLERNPESAAAIINLLYQELADHKKQSVVDELQKLLVGGWAQKLVKKQKKEDREELAESLRSDISAMAASLLNMGIDAKVNLEEMKC